MKHHLLTLLNHQLLWRIALGLSLLAILYLATTSNPYPIPSAPSDKVNHLIAFLELAILARLGWPKARVLPVVAALIGYGGGIELIQSQLDHREFSLADLLADGAGIALGLLCWPVIQGLQNQNATQATDVRQPPNPV